MIWATLPRAEGRNKSSSFPQCTSRISKVFFSFKRNISFSKTHNGQGWATEIAFCSAEARAMSRRRGAGDDPETQGFIPTMAARSGASMVVFPPAERVTAPSRAPPPAGQDPWRTLPDSAFCLTPDCAVTDRSDFSRINRILQMSVLEALRVVNTART